MTNENRLKHLEIQRKFALAKQYLKESLDCLSSKGMRLATDGAYNAAELAMKVAILLKDEDVPKRHGGIAQKFSTLC